MKIIEAKIGAYGCAYGASYVLDRDLNITKREINDIEAEERRIEKAIDAVNSSLSHAKENADEESVSIIDAQSAMLYDVTFWDEVRQMIRTENACAEYAVAEIGKAWAEKLAKIDNPYISARSADIKGITQKLIRKLIGDNSEVVIDTPSVIFSDELTPEFVATINKSNIRAFVSTKGSKMSHVSILCENYGIPYLFGVDFTKESIKTGTEVAVDTKTASVYIEPTDAIKQKIDECLRQDSVVEASDYSTGAVSIYANIGSVKEAEDAIKAGADGIGLFRTEFLYMGEELPSEEEQFEVYKDVVTAMEGRPVMIRTMDIGADKESPCVKLAPQKNPALGKRAIRICLEDKDLFKTQLRAILRASGYGDVKLMYPMITSCAEIERIDAILKEAAAELETQNIPYSIPSQGIMIETPSSALLSDELASKVDFFSIGTNDLTQYTLAVDRMAEDLEDYFDSHSEAVMRLIKMVVRNAHEAGIRVGICGQLGGDEWAIPKLVELGIDELSVSSSQIGRTKAIVSMVK